MPLTTSIHADPPYQSCLQTNNEFGDECGKSGSRQPRFCTSLMEGVEDATVEINEDASNNGVEDATAEAVVEETNNKKIGKQMQFFCFHTNIC